MRTSIIVATVMLVASPAVSYAAGGRGASSAAPGQVMQTTTPTPQDRGAAHGASTLTPASEMKTATPPAPRGASTFAPGQTK